MTRVLNQLDPDTAARVRAAISGKPVLKEAKPKRSQPVKCYVPQLHRVYTETSTHVIQLPIAFRGEEYNAKRTPWYLREKWVKEKREAVWLAMQAYLPRFDVDQLRSMEFVRIGLKKMDGKDNLRAAFKPIVDATCSRVRWGDACWENIKVIGSADDWMEQRGIEWTYRQQKCESNPRLYGIQIILHCAPASTE